jgi:hypothetical protein
MDWDSRTGYGIGMLLFIFLSIFISHYPYMGSDLSHPLFPYISHSTFPNIQTAPRWMYKRNTSKVQELPVQFYSTENINFSITNYYYS